MSSNDDRGDYLYDARGSAPLDLVELEQRLAGYRGSDFVPRPRSRRATVLGTGMSIAAAAVAVFVFVAREQKSTSCEHGIWHRVAGESRRECLAPEYWLETEVTAWVDIDGLGQVEVDGQSQLRLRSTDDHTRRLELARGRLQATIVAPPRIFLIDTPAGTAIDLGCAYELTVADDGTTVLSVTAGAVALAGHDREELLVPAGVSVRTTPGRTGLPHWADADPRFVAALLDWTRDPPSDPSVWLALATTRDAPTLWHAIALAGPTRREPIIDRLHELWPAPEGAKALVLAGDADAMQRWWREIDWSRSRSRS